MRKAALICAMVMMVSIIPVFALNQTDNNTTGVKVQDQTKTQTSTAQKQNHCNQEKCKVGSVNCGTCDGDQHKYQHGQKNNANAGANNCDQQHKYRYGQKTR
jgi:hypothetical protein